MNIFLFQRGFYLVQVFIQGQKFALYVIHVCMIQTTSQKKFMLHVYTAVLLNGTHFQISLIFLSFFLKWSKYPLNSFIFLWWIAGKIVQNKIRWRENIKHSDHFLLNYSFSSLSLCMIQFPFIRIVYIDNLAIFPGPQKFSNNRDKLPFNQDPILERFYCTMTYATDENNEQKVCYETSNL